MRDTTEMSSREIFPDDHITNETVHLIKDMIEIGMSGNVVLIKLDGLRAGSEDEPKYTVMISGPSIGVGYIRSDDNNLTNALYSVISVYKSSG